MDIDLESMSDDELLELHNAVQKAVAKKDKKMRGKALKAARKAAADMGFLLDDIYKPSKSPVKYRNPSNPDQTWTGRGRKPKWIIEKLDSGSDISTFEV